MTVKLIYGIKRFKDVKFWVEQSVFSIKIYRNQKTFFKISSPSCASKIFCLYICYYSLHIVWEWLAGTRGDVQQQFLPNKK